jgi:hypothetical protein
MAVDSQKGCCIPLGCVSGKDYAGVGKVLAKGLGLNGAGSIRNGTRNQAQDPSCGIGPAGGYVQKASQSSLRVMDRMARASHGRVAGVEVLVAIDCDRAMLGKGSPYSVRPFCGFGPVGSGPKAPAPEGFVIGLGTASFHGNAVSIAK